ncbi:hypothetical protein HYU14_00020 [Candidatus Woesearchaeota archaeon]|nr:hypothetical protein [Candidatus Woesearchaeota archaeon]
MADEKVLKVKKKTWVSILAPKSLGSAFVGEVPCTEPGTLVGRNIRANLMVITNDMKKQHINVKIKITAIADNKASTELLGFLVLPSYLRRLVKRGKKRVDFSIIVLSKDGKRVRVKTMIIPITSVRGTVGRTVYVKAKEFLVNYFANAEFEPAVHEAFQGNLQKLLRDSLHKVYPIKVVEFPAVYLEVERKKGQKAEKQPVPSEEGHEEGAEENADDQQAQGQDDAVQQQEDPEQQEVSGEIQGDAEQPQGDSEHSQDDTEQPQGDAEQVQNDSEQPNGDDAEQVQNDSEQQDNTEQQKKTAEEASLQ